MKPIGSTIKQRSGDYVLTLQVVGYNKKNTHEVYQVVHEVYNPLYIDYVCLAPTRY